ELEMRTEAEVLRAPAIAVNADLRHSLAARGAAIVLFIEPESRAGEIIRARFFGARDFVVMETSALTREIDAFRTALDGDTTRQRLVALGQALLVSLEGKSAKPAETDARILKVVEAVTSQLDGQMKIEDAGRGINLSASRLRHLFAEEIGLPFKTYVLWRRMMRAVELMAEGASATDAAHGAGFADSAHFARTFKRTFGMSSTTLKVV